MSTGTVTVVPMMPPAVRRIRAYFAPVNRSQGIPTIFDPSQNGSFDLDTPPAPWLDLGWLDTFERKSGSTVTPLRSGAPGLATSQVRTEIDALITVGFQTWGKLQMAITSGSEQMNLLAPAPGAGLNGSGGKAGAAIPLQSGSTADFLAIASSDLSRLPVGQMVAVDVDYSGQTGYVGSGISGTYVGSAAAVQPDIDAIRRISFNVGRIVSATSTGVQLAQPLIAGVPTAGMSVQPILGFVDREGSNFFHEWSGLFVIAGEQNDRIYLHYPRLQIAASGADRMRPVGSKSDGGTLEHIIQLAELRALPVTDLNDGAEVVCFRSYLPAAATSLW